MRWQITPASIERRNEIISCIATPPLRRRIGCDNKSSISYFWWGSMVISIFLCKKSVHQFFHRFQNKERIKNCNQKNRTSFFHRKGGKEKNDKRMKLCN